MSVISQVPSPLLIHSSKTIEWLLNRKLLQKNYPKCLAMLEDQVNKQIEVLPENVDYPVDLPSIFMASVQTYEAIQKVDTQTDFFGRASHSVRSWRDIVDGFKKQNVHIAELSESLQELTVVSVPKCKGVIADEQKRITDLRQRIKEYSLNASKLDDLVEKAFREFSLELGETQIKLRLLEQASQVFPRLQEIVSSLDDLKPALALYETMTNYVRNSSRSAMKERDGDSVRCCPTLKLLIEAGHIRLYTWQTGRNTEQWGQDDDWIPALLDLERKLQFNQNTEILVAEPMQLVDTETNEITWDGGEIDFGSIEIETGDNGPVEIDLEVELVSGEGDKPEDSPTGACISGSHSDSVEIPSGKNARLLLDTIQGRNALLNDLVELGAFLGRFCEDLSENQDTEEDNTRSITSAQGGSIALQQMILQNAPASLQCVSFKEVSTLLARLEAIREGLTNSVLSQLLMIRSKPGFLDRLVNRLQDLRDQAERSKRRVAEAHLQINEAMAEQERQATILLKHRANCKRLVTLIEEEISKLCNRPVQIIGQVLTL